MKVSHNQIRSQTIALVVAALLVATLALGPLEGVDGRRPGGNSRLSERHRLGQSKLACGQHYMNASRLVGGSEAQLGRFPHVVQVRYEALTHNLSKKYISVKTYMCTGSIVDKHHVVTTATCLELRKLYYKVIGPPMNVRITNVGDVINEEGLQYPASGYAIHMKFNFDRELRNCTSNIAIVRTILPMNFIIHPVGYAVNQVCLPPADIEYKDDSNQTFASWSYIDVNGKLNETNILRYGEVQVREREKCGNDLTIAWDQFCMVTNTGPCRNEFGSPVMRLIEGSRWELTGLFSHFGPPSNVRCKPGTYLLTRVATYQKWILAKIASPVLFSRTSSS